MGYSVSLDPEVTEYAEEHSISEAEHSEEGCRAILRVNWVFDRFEKPRVHLRRPCMAAMSNRLLLMMDGIGGRQSAGVQNYG